MTKVPQWVLNIGVVLIIAAYGFIFSNILDKIAKNEIGIKENTTRIEALNPTIMEIKTNLANINANIEWIKKEFK